MQYLIAVSKHMDYKLLKASILGIPWRLEKLEDGYYFKYTRSSISVKVSYNFNDVLHQSTIIIGLAGTANEQAMFTGRILITFIGTGPQSSKKRFLQQQKLIESGRSIFFDSNDIGVLSKKISAFINDNDFQWQPLSHFEQSVAPKIAEKIKLSL